MLTRLLIAWIVYAGIVGFVVGGTIVSALLEPSHAQIHQQNPDAEQNAANTHSKEKTEEALARYTLWLTGFTGLLALATIGLGIATVGLYLTGEKQIGIATRVAEHTEDAFRRLERPYLLPHFDNMTTHHLVVKFVPHGVPYMTFKMANFGKLPAILRSISVGLIDNPPFPLISTFAIERKSYDVIPPGGLTKETRIPVTGGEVGKPFVGQAATLLILHGIVRYEDPTGAVHTDSFCMRGLANNAGFTIDGGDEYNWTETEYPPPRPHRVRGEPRE